MCGIYFSRPRRGSLLHFTRFSFDRKALVKTCTNGSSELMSNISMSVVSMLYNSRLMYYAGENGIAAYGVLMYVSMIFQAIFIGFAVGTAPVVSFHYGAQNRGELKSLLKKSTFLLAICSLAMFAAGELFSAPLSRMFVGYDEELLVITTRAFALFSFSFLFSGFSIFGSSFFTALNDGGVSAAISFLRSLVLPVAAIIVLPLIWQLDGVWYALAGSETASIFISLTFLLAKRKKYGY